MGGMSISCRRSTNLPEMLLISFPQHPQYSGKKLLPINNNPYQPIKAHLQDISMIKYIDDLETQFLRHKMLSKKIGCSYENPSLFLITHIFCNNSVFPDALHKSRNSVTALAVA